MRWTWRGTWRIRAVLNVTIDTVAPAVPSVPDLDPASDTGVSNTDNLTKDNTPTFIGTAEVDATVYIFVNGNTKGNAIATGGHYSVTTSVLALDGVWRITAAAQDAAGNYGGNSQGLNVTIDTTAPSPAPTLAPVLDPASDTGVLGDNITADTTPTFDIDPAAAPYFVFYRDGVAISGYQPAAPTYTTATQQDGTYVYQVTGSDAAGNETALTPGVTVTIDSMAEPPIVVLTNDTGVSNTDLITSDPSLTITNLETGATVQCSLDGGTTWHDWPTGYAPVEGENTVEVTQTDPAGHVSLPASLTFTLDTTAPAAPGVALTSDTGSSSTDGITMDGSLTLSGVEAGALVEYSIDAGTTWTLSFTAVEGSNTVEVRQTDVAGNPSPASAPFTFTLDTTAPAAPNAALANDTGISSTDLITSDGSLAPTGVEPGALVEYSYSTDGGTTWSSWASSFTPVEGANTVEVRQTDVAGNAGPASTPLTFTLDTIALAPTVALTNDTGSSSTDGITMDGSLTLTGVETGATAEYSINGTDWFAIADFTPVEGSNTVEVRQTDVAGNVSPASTPLTFTFDTTRPFAPGVSLNNDTGSSPTDYITMDGTLKLTGVESGALVEYSIDGGTTWTCDLHGGRRVEHCRGASDGLGGERQLPARRR